MFRSCHDARHCVAFIIFMLAIAVTVTGARPAHAQIWQPRQPVELVIMAGQGGGADRLARFIQSIVERNRFMRMPLIPINKGGGSGAEALRYLKDQGGDPHVLMATLNSYYTTPLRTDIGVDIAEFTPIARLALDTFVLWVNALSPITSVEDYVAAVRAADGAWKMGGTGTGQEDSLVTAMLEQEFGLSFTYVPFSGGGTVAKNLVGGHIDSTVNNPSEQMGFYQAGKSRPLAAFTPERLPSLPDVPTMRELGHDLVYFMQRSVVAPGNIPDDAKSYYTDLFEQVATSSDWTEYCARQALDPAYLTGEDLQAFFLGEREAHRTLLTAIGELTAQ